jgi:hypothetical protein
MNIGKYLQDKVFDLLTGTDVPVISFNLSLTAIDPRINFKPVGTSEQITFSIVGNTVVNNAVTLNNVAGSAEYLVITDAGSDEVILYECLAFRKVYQVPTSVTYAAGEIVIDMQNVLTPDMVTKFNSWMIGTVAISAPATVYLELSTSSTFTPPAVVDGYSKKPATFSKTYTAKDGTTITNSNVIVFDEAVNNAWGDITYVFVTDGTDTYLSAIMDSVPYVNIGHTLNFDVGSVRFVMR